MDRGFVLVRPPKPHKCSPGPSDLAGDFTTDPRLRLGVKRGFENHRGLHRKQLRNLAKGPRCHQVQAFVPAAGVNVAHVDLGETVAKIPNKLGSYAHGWVDLTGVPDVKAEGSIGKIAENLGEFLRGAAGGFPFVHVLNTEEATELSPPPGVMDCVRVDNNMVLFIQCRCELLNNFSFHFRGKGTGGVNGHVVKIAQVGGFDVLHQSGQFVRTQCGELNRPQAGVPNQTYSPADVAQRKGTR